MGRFNGNIQMYHEYYDSNMGMWIAGWFPVMGLRYQQYFAYSDRSIWRDLGTEDAVSSWEPPTSTVSGHGIYLMVYHNGAWKRVTKYQIRHDEYVEYIGNRISLLPANSYNYGTNCKTNIRLEAFYIARGTNTNQNLFYTGEGNPEQLSNYYYRIYYKKSNNRIVFERKVGSNFWSLEIPYTITQGANNPCYWGVNAMHNLDGNIVIELEKYTWNAVAWRWDIEKVYQQTFSSLVPYLSSTTKTYLGDTNVRWCILVEISGANANDTDKGHISIMKNGWPTGDYLDTDSNVIPIGSNLTDNQTYANLGNYAYTESTYTWE